MRIFSIDRYMTRAAEMPAEEWITEQFLFCGESKLKGKGCEKNRDVHVALMIHAKHIRASRLHVLHAAHAHTNSRCEQDHACPYSRAGVLDPAGRINERARNGERCHDSRVQENERRRDDHRPCIAEPVERFCHSSLL